MASSSRRTSKRPGRLYKLAILGILILVALLASSLYVFALFREELKHPGSRAIRMQDRFLHLVADRVHTPPIDLYIPPEDENNDSATAHTAGAGATHQTMDTKSAEVQKTVSAKPVEDFKKPTQQTMDTKSVEVQRTISAKLVEDLKPSSAEAIVTTPPLDAHRDMVVNSSNTIIWKIHEGKSCQNYADGDATARSLEDSKAACVKKDTCVAIECPHGQQNFCTLRAIANLVDYKPADCYELFEVSPSGKLLTTKVHPDYNSLLKHYPFQQVTTQSGNQVNIILVRSPVDEYQYKLYQKYKDEILFLGISSMNDYPMKEPGSNSKFDYLGMFPGFLHMMREPEKHFPPHVKTLLMSQSDFALPDYPPRNYSIRKKYDFTYSASDCDVDIDGRGWCGWSKNWSFVKEALVTMCDEFQLTGVLVATKNKAGTKAYTIPDKCKGKMTQTTYLAQQSDYFDYLKQSRFAFLPQVHDASPRVATQALAHDVPLLMNYYILGGWKYVTDKTGEFFHDMRDFKQMLSKILNNSDIPGRYEPRRWVLENYGNAQSGKRLLDFVQKHFADRVQLPKGTKLLLP